VKQPQLWLISPQERKADSGAEEAGAVIVGHAASG